MMKESDSIVPYNGLRSAYNRLVKPVGAVLVSAGLFAGGFYTGMEYEKAKSPSPVELMRVEQEASVLWDGNDFIVEDRVLKRQRVDPSSLEERVGIDSDVSRGSI